MKQKSLPQGPFNSLVVFGESTVEGGGWLTGPEERWADIFWHQLEHAQEMTVSYHNTGLGASVISPSSPGYQSSIKPSAAERLDQEVISFNPDLVIIAYGLNDMRAGMPRADFNVELKKIVDRIRDCGNPLIIIVNVYHMSAYHFYPPFGKGSTGKTRDYNTMLVEFAEENNCVYADVWSAEGQKDYLVHQDTVHANKVGNMLIANKVFESVIQAAPGILNNVEKRDADTQWTRQCFNIREKGIEESHHSFSY
jgi:lysophospholipase L1-like esterase